jgi:Flp pilus assembly protein TadB
MTEYHARYTRARKLQLAIVTGEFLIAGAAGVAVGLTRESALWGITAALVVAVVFVLIGALLFWWLLRTRHRA